MIILLKIRPIIALIASIIILSAILPGCSSGGSAEKKPASSSGQKPKAPSELKNIASDLDMIISDLDRKVKRQKMPAMQQNLQLDPQEKSGQQAQGQNQGQAQESQGTSQGQGQSQQHPQEGQAKGQSSSAANAGGQASSQNTAADWQQEYTSLKNIHVSWNKLEPQAVEAGLSVSTRNEFEKALEKLTAMINDQKQEESLSAAVDLYKNYAGLAGVFTMQVPAEYFNVRYEIMAAILQVGARNWKEASSHLPGIEEHWSHLKVQAAQAGPQLISQTDFAITDLEQAIKNQQAEMAAIKGEIAMTNLKALEDKLASQPAGGE